MAVDVVTEIEIARPRAEVAAYASDPANATSWYEQIKHSERRDEGPLAVGSQVFFTAEFLRRRLAYTYEVTAWEPGKRLVMRTADGPFPMETTYTWADAGEGRTRMTLRNRGVPSGFSRLAAPVLAAAIGRANRKDLARLRQRLEASS